MSHRHLGRRPDGTVDDDFNPTFLRGEVSNVGFLGLPSVGDPVVRFFRKLWEFIRG